MVYRETEDVDRGHDFMMYICHDIKIAYISRSG